MTITMIRIHRVGASMLARRARGRAAPRRLPARRGAWRRARRRRRRRLILPRLVPRGGLRVHVVIVAAVSLFVKIFDPTVRQRALVRVGDDETRLCVTFT